jgi:ribosomal protein S27AE
MPCSKCGREAFLLSTAQQWRRENWVVTDKLYCSSCATVYIAENDKIWQVPIGQHVK